MNLSIKFIVTLCLAIFAVQGMTASTVTTEKVEVEEVVFKYVENAHKGLEYLTPSNTSILESTTPNKHPLVFSTIPQKISIAFKWINVPISFSHIFVRDHKSGLKILVFPFHSFW